MAVNFPDSPYTGQTFTVGDRTWTWSGNSWDSASPLAYAPLAGAAFTGNVSSTGTISAGAISANNVYNPNYVINGGMDIWQRGTSVVANTGNHAFTADRWDGYRAVAGMTTSRQPSGLTGLQYCMRIQRDSGNTATSTLYMTQSIETANSLPLAGQTVTMSFYARAGANYSATAGLFSLVLYSGTGTDQNVVTTGLTNQTGITAINANLTTSWQRFTATVAVASTVTQLAPYFVWNPTGTAGVADYVEVTGVQLEVGTVATPFKRAAGNIEGELAACQRYYVRFTNPNGDGSGLGNGWAYSATGAVIDVYLPVTMRISPHSVDWVGVTASDHIGYTSSVTAIVISGKNPDSVFLSITSSSLNTSRLVTLQAGTGIGFSAELT